MTRGFRVRCSEFAVLSLTVATLLGCSGKDGKDGKECTVGVNDAGASVLVCPNGTTVLPNPTGPTACTIVTGTNGVRKIVCPDGTEVVVPTPGLAASCAVVSNGDGTSNVTCPSGDGGMQTIVVRNALVNYTNASADEKAALDLKVTVGGISFPAAGNPVVSLKILDGDGNAVTGIPPADMRFALLKLVTAKQGNDTWVSYLASNATSTAATETAAAKASTSSGALLDNGDGTYSYTFAHFGATNSGTTYDANAVHRFALIISETNNPFAPVNVVKDFIPATGVDVTGQNDKVDGNACLSCHSSFRAKAGGTGAFHGGARYDVRVCVACHNDQRRFQALGTGTPPGVDLDAPGVVDATGKWAGAATLVNGEAFVDLPVFIHKIHMGDQLTLTGGTYTGVDTPYETTYPQDIRNCTKCHNDKVAAMADNFKTRPSRKACGSCHDDVTFLAAAPAGRKLHSGNPQADDSMCATCHPATGPKGNLGIGVLDAHVAVADPDPTATWLGGTNANTNAAFLPAAGQVPAGAVKIAYDVKSVTRDLNKNPSIVFRFLKLDNTSSPDGGIGGTPIAFNTFGAGATELMDGFANSPSVYFAFAVPQDGVAAPADFNASASGYIKSIWNGTATGSGAGTMTYDATTGYYTITLTGVVIPDTATMLTGGVGYTYSLSSTPPLVQINLPAYPYGDGTVIKGCAAGKMCGGLIVPAQDVVAPVATDAATKKAYATRRPIVDTKNCIACHEQLGANPTFHAGQRNDGATCSFCHNPNRTSSGWSASSSTFIHGIHGASERTVDFNWHAACPPNTTTADGTCTLDNADPNFGKVTYPGILKNCTQCHVAGAFDFSLATSAAALPNLLPSTVGTGVYTASISNSPNVELGPDYGTAFSTANVTSGTMTVGTQGPVACTTAAPCVCSLAAPCEASSTTLINSPITAACSACHDNPTYIEHMREMGGTYYGTRASAVGKTETCLMCHGAGAVAAIADVHK